MIQVLGIIVRGLGYAAELKPVAEAIYYAFEREETADRIAEKIRTPAPIDTSRDAEYDRRAADKPSRGEG